MRLASLPPDDLPPDEITALDIAWRFDLEQSLEKRFYKACDDVIQSLLSRCDWYYTIHTSVLMLVINCPTCLLNWQILNNLLAIGTPLAQFSQTAKIRVCPPIGQGTPFDIRVDELPIYYDSTE